MATERRRRALALAALFALASSAPALADAAAGRAKAQTCAACHGIDGMSKIPNAPNIAGQPETYLKAQLEAYRSGERKDEMMRVVAKALTDDDIDNLVAWYSSIEVTATEPD
jgi:cytochrome c553